jgi:hypothetical protein
VLPLLQVTAERKQWKRFGLAAQESADDSVTGGLLFAVLAVLICHSF